MALPGDAERIGWRAIAEVGGDQLDLARLDLTCTFEQPRDGGGVDIQRFGEPVLALARTGQAVPDPGDEAFIEHGTPLIRRPAAFASFSFPIVGPFEENAMRTPLRRSDAYVG